MYSARKNKEKQTTNKSYTKTRKKNKTPKPHLSRPNNKKKEQQDTKIEIKYKRGTIQK